MNTKKQKQKKKKCGISGENFSRHPHFREKEFVFFWPNQQNLLQNCIYEEKVIINNDLNDLMSEKTFENQWSLNTHLQTLFCGYQLKRERLFLSLAAKAFDIFFDQNLIRTPVSNYK